jgi:site-specific DNA-adenine methylase
MNYGLPYMGSKNKIAEWVLSYLPKADNFYDLFCGGCAITHCAMSQRKYKYYIINDIKGIMPQLFVDCLNGKYKDEKRWISREEFFNLKDTDGYVHTCFSFGNKGQTYLYGADKEQIKKAMHYAVMFDDLSMLQNLGIDAKEILEIKDMHKKYSKLKRIMKQYVGRCENIERLQALNRLQNIEVQGNVVNFNKSYDEIEIKPNSIIYCDIPYKNTGTYNEDAFDYNKFYDWALRQTQPIFISEYDMPNEFICIAERKKISSMSPTKNNTKSIERIFIPKNQHGIYKHNVKQLNLF